MGERLSWVVEAADLALARARRGPGDGTVVCASGISPSGPIHLGNLREVMVPHLVAEELKSRGEPCVHILSWDDYDRLRKVPIGVPSSFAEHIGRPLTAIPDPWNEFPNWAERFKAPFREALGQLGIAVREISQTEMYRSGVYADLISKAIAASEQIDGVLKRYQTLADDAAPDGSEEGPDSEARGIYSPFRPYCDTCGRDTTVVTAVDGDSAGGRYTCRACGDDGLFSARKAASGKLVWKVDWPMRWAYENVAFEAGGVDHSSPGSSFSVGREIAASVFGQEPPVYLPYSFVGARGAAKLSGSKGIAPTPSDALRFIEPGILRWIYARRKPSQAITLDFGSEVLRVYDEWDALARRVEQGSAEAPESAVFNSAVRTHDCGAVERPIKTVSFRLLSSVCDITANDSAQILRVLRQADPRDGTFDLADLQPRLDLARNWTLEQLPASQRTTIRLEPDRELIASLSPEERKGVALLADRLEESRTLEQLTTLVYAVPKLLRGLDADAAATPELKQAQRAYFVLLYGLLVGKDTGPRLPTLLLAIGPRHSRLLLTGSDD